LKLQAQLRTAKRREELQALKDAKRLKLLEEQLAYVQWKKRENHVHMIDAIARSQEMLELDAITEVAVDDMEDKRLWMQHVIADEMKRPLRVHAGEKFPPSYEVETKKRRQVARLKNHHTTIKELERTLKDKEHKRRLHEKHRYLRSQSPPVPLWESRHSVSSDGRLPSSEIIHDIVDGPMSIRRAEQITRLNKLRREVYKEFQDEKKQVKRLVKEQKDQPLSASMHDSVDSLRSTVKLGAVRLSATR